ncbi:MAG: MBL fold metallo-hydrolase [bacterium]
MEILRLSPSTFRLKTKTIVVSLDNNVSINAKAKSFEIIEPGEYEVEGVSVFGFGIALDKVAYLIQTEGLRIVYLNKVQQELTESQIEEFGRVDVLMVSAGSSAVKMVEALEPTYVLPFELDVPVTSFVAAYERGSREASSLSVSIATLPQDLTEVVVLSQS